MKSAVVVSVFGLVLPVLVAGSPADARIVCKDGFQKSGGNWISTPYCNDEHLAEIARRHGMKVSGADVRASAARKYELCRMVGHTAAASHYCPGEGARGRRH